MKGKFVILACLLVYLTQESNGLLSNISKFMKNKKNQNCDCPCREYWTTKCSVEYKTECKQLYTHRECKKIPVEKPMKVKETECQKCIRYYETVFETKQVKQCVDVYDEKCETKYPAKCTEDQSCTMVYQTKCDTVGYNQKCQQVPVQKCQQITKCHRIPKTTCRPFKKEKCGKKPVQVPKKKMMHKCLPYESRIPEDVTSCANENPSSAYGAPSSGNGAPSSSYGAPQGSSYSAPVKTLSDMIAPAGPIPQSPSIQNYASSTQNTIPIGNAVQSNQDSYGSPLSNPISSNLNQDSYGKPLSNPLGNAGNFVQTVGDSYNVEGPVNNNNPFLTQATNTNTNNALPAPSVYASPNRLPDYTSELLTPRQPKQNTGFPSPHGLRSDPGTTLATIKVVNPPADIVGHGPFVPSDPPIVANIDDNVVHPNQLVHSDFKPSVRLPDNFVHQIGNMIIHPDIQMEEIFKPAEDNSMKKMVFPASSAEAMLDEELQEEMMELMKQMNSLEMQETTTEMKEEETTTVANLEDEYDYQEAEDFEADYYDESVLQLLRNSAIEAQIQELFLKDEEQRSKEEEALSSEEQEETPIVKRKRRRRKRPYNRHPHGSDIRYSTTFGSKLRGHSV